MSSTEPGTSWLVLHSGNRIGRTIPLVDDLSIGRDIGAPDTDGHLAIGGDPKMSRLAALVVRRPVGWCIQAPQTPNGLFVNGDRLAEGAVKLLSAGDEILMGERTKVIFHSLSPTATDRSRTELGRPLPDLTATERKVLAHLCLPLLDGDTFTPPATVAVMAAQLFVTESAIKQHLGRLYLKLDVPDGTDRRSRLANEAMQRGVVRRADLEVIRSAGR